MSSSNDTKSKRLIKNTIWFTAGTLLSKIITFLLVPFYTNILSTEQYSISDLLTTTVSLAIPFFSLIITEAVLRFSLDKSSDRRQIFSCGLYIIIMGAIILSIISLLVFPRINVLRDYTFFFILTYIVTCLNTLESEFLKGLEKVKELSIVGTVQTVSIVTLNILFLLVLRQGISGYLISYIISYCIANILIFFVARIYKYIVFPTNIDKKILKQMLSYSIPMVPNSAMWWITNSSDRYLVTYMVSVAANGILSVSYKIPSMLSIAISVFMGAWQISVVEDFETDEGKKYFNNVYEKFLISGLILSSVLIGASEFLGKVMYAKEFFEGWRLSTVLILGFNFHAVAGFLGTAFTSAKDTKPLFYSTLIAALVNIGLNVLLIKCIGTMGAVIATVGSYFITFCIRRLLINKYVTIKIKSKKIVISYLLIVIQTLTMLLVAVNVARYVVVIICILSIIVINATFFKDCINSMKRLLTR